MRAPLTVIKPPVVLPAATAPSRRPGGIALAVWDVDRTLVRGDTLLPFLRRFIGAARLGTTVLDAFARSAGPDRRSAAKATVVQRVLGGRELGAVNRVARDYVNSQVIPRLRPDSIRRWQWHRGQGHHVVLASASLGLYLEHLGARLGADDVIATDLTVINGRYTGALSGPNCRGQRKAERVAAYLATRNVGQLWVYGDGRADKPMLALADVAVRVRPFSLLPDLNAGNR